MVKAFDIFSHNILFVFQTVGDIVRGTRLLCESPLVNNRFQLNFYKKDKHFFSPRAIKWMIYLRLTLV